MVILYASFKTDVGFLLQKQEYLHNNVWLVAFYVHVFTSVVCLLAGFTQFSRSILSAFPRLHKYMGRIYVYNILLINFPAGFIMAIYANGHLPSKIAFLLLDCLWWWFTYKGVLAAKQKKMDLHKMHMIRSYALTFSAITLRTWKIILLNTTAWDAGTIYMIDAWLGFVPNLLLAEWIIRRQKRRAASALKAKGA